MMKKCNNKLCIANRDGENNCTEFTNIKKYYKCNHEFHNSIDSCRIQKNKVDGEYYCYYCMECTIIAWNAL